MRKFLESMIVVGLVGAPVIAFADPPPTSDKSADTTNADTTAKDAKDTASDAVNGATDAARSM